MDSMEKTLIKSWANVSNNLTTKDIDFSLDRDSHFYPDHLHEGYNIDIVQSGLLESWIGKRIFHASPGQLLWVNHHEVHGGRSVSNESLFVRSLYLSEAFVNTLASAFGIKRVDRLIDPVISDEKLFMQIGWIHHLVETQADLLEIETRLVEVISSVLLRFATTCSSMNQIAEHKAVNSVREYLLTHYCENISLKQLAELVDLNPSYLVRAFRNEVGLPPYRYLTEIRMAKARSLLLAGVAPAKVAAEVGACDQSHLNRHFKRSSGMTPGSYTRTRF
jgi:AraC-like DNA-binding protein